MNGRSEGGAAGEISRLADHFFRHEAGKLVSVLTGIFGIERLQLAEDVVQEAFVRALQTWPFYGVPKNPAAWLTQTAKNLALDVIRRESRFREKLPEVEASIERWAGASKDGAEPAFDGEIQDDRLRLMFACCHPLIPPEARTALALKTLCGFNVIEIANAFLTTEAAIAKRLTRARQKIQEQGVPFEIPSGEESARRVDGVLQAVYLLFNEGYKASSGENLVKEDLCREAIRLGTLLADHPAGDQPRTHALVALMFLNTARLPARMDEHGHILRLKEQDRSTWDRAMIMRGLRHLDRATVGGELSEYHLQAGIAACHCTAADDASTDWPRILELYDRWLEISDSPVVALNRAVALANVKGAEEGIHALETILNRSQLDSYYLWHAVLGEFETRRRHFPAAAGHLRKAIALTGVKTEQSFLARRLAELEAEDGPKR